VFTLAALVLLSTATAAAIAFMLAGASNSLLLTWLRQ
jgi:hypothetical protein